MIDEIVERLRAGEVVALPTETVFGLACALNSEEGLAKLIQLKSREVSSGKVFTLVPRDFQEFAVFAKTDRLKHIRIRSCTPDSEMAGGEAKTAEVWLVEHTPGAVTAILPKNPNFKHPYFDNFEKIGLRIPDYPLFRELLPLIGPILLTSANPRDLPAARTAAEAQEYFPDVFVVGGEAGGVEPSTVIDFSGEEAAVLREGPVKLD